MKKRIVFIERQQSEFVSIENVFRQVAKSLPMDKFEIVFQQTPFGNSLIGTLKNLLFFKRQQADIYHVTGHIHYITLRLPAEKTILTVHDLGFLHTRNGLRRFALKKLFLDWPIKKARYVTAVSQKTKDEIMRFVKSDSDKIKVIENPLCAGFHGSHSRTFNEKCPTILQVGITNNKNISTLTEAIRGLSCKLIVVGKADNELISLMSQSSINYEIKQDLNQAEIIEAYRNADIVAFCSTYEGFGLPIIEAQAMGKPVVTSNLSPMKEVSGGAAMLVDPNNVTSIRDGILRIISDAALREKNIEKGLENVKRFDPQLISKQYEDYYFDVLTRSRNCT